MKVDQIYIDNNNDNYNFVLHHEGQTAVVDPSNFEDIDQCLQKHGWNLDFIFNTHHHWDHVDGNLPLKEKYQCHIYCSEHDFSRIPGADTGLNHGDVISLGSAQAQVIDVPGHTLGHIAYFFQEEEILFCGDTLFSLGCGRLFEGSAEQLWDSLNQLKKLPPSTTIYCAHEYTLYNAHFASQFESKNPQFTQRQKEVEKLRQQHQPTVPVTLELELQTNPFLRAPNLEEFTRRRKLRDQF